jgi:sodium/hydrogen exchanger 8
MIFLLLIAIMGGHFLKKKKSKYLQEAGLTTIIGMLAGLLLDLLNIEVYFTNMTNHFVSIFLILLLPPIIFESGYSLEKI